MAPSRFQVPPPPVPTSSHSVCGGPPEAATSLQLSVRKEGKRAAVRRPERRACVLGSGERSYLAGIERAERQATLVAHAPATGRRARGQRSLGAVFPGKGIDTGARAAARRAPAEKWTHDMVSEPDKRTALRPPIPTG